VQSGLVASLNRSGGNATGVYIFTDTVEQKKLELLHELVPKATVIAGLVNPTNPNAENVSHAQQAAARTLGLQIRIANASSESDIDSAFTTILQQGAGALVARSRAGPGTKQSKLRPWLNSLLKLSDYRPLQYS
jgi:putative tryptophan/tyrosine transport system substrate-binding protein